MKHDMSPDQEAAMKAVLDCIDRGDGGSIAVTGYAGSGKTFVLERIFKKVTSDRNVHVINDKNNFKTVDDMFNIAVVAPTNKAASVLNNRGIPACTIHQVIYKPVFHKFYNKLEKIESAYRDGLHDQADSIVVEPGIIKTEKGDIEITKELCDSFHDLVRKKHSVGNILSRFGYAPLDFVICWELRHDNDIDLVFVDESSMITEDTKRDIESVGKTVVFFGDPGQLPPVVSGRKEARMIFSGFSEDATYHLDTIHRQKDGSPIIELASILREDISFVDFQKKYEDMARKYPDKIYVSRHPYADIMLYSPYLVWMNRTRVSMNMMFRHKHGLTEDDYLKTGEPIVCEGVIASRSDVKFRNEMAGKGFHRGANCWYAGGGYSGNLGHVLIDGQHEVRKNVPLIYDRETLEGKRVISEWIPSSGKGVIFKYGAAITIHKSQGSQWNTVQFSSNDLRVADWMGKTDEDGIPLWRRLAYVALTRAIDSVVYVMNDDDIHNPTSGIGEHVIEWNANRYVPEETGSVVEQGEVETV